MWGAGQPRGSRGGQEGLVCAREGAGVWWGLVWGALGLAAPRASAVQSQHLGEEGGLNSVTWTSVRQGCCTACWNPGRACPFASQTAFCTWKQHKNPMFLLWNVAACVCLLRDFGSPAIHVLCHGHPVPTHNKMLARAVWGRVGGGAGGRPASVCVLAGCHAEDP